MKKSPQYVAAAGVFLLAIYYHVSIAPPSDDSADDGKSQTEASVVPAAVFADLDIDHATKHYENRLLSRKGDWYRVSLVAQSLDGDESLRVSLSSALGRSQVVGSADVSKSDGERYFEFVVSADAAYEDIVVEKVNRPSDADQWQGGRVRLANVFVSRLDVSSVKEAAMLQKTLFGERDISSRTLDGLDISSKNIELPLDTHFLQGQVFESTDDAYMLSVNMRIKQNGALGTGKYRLELREYDPKSHRVADQPLRRVAFSVKDLKSLADTDGSYRLDIPFRLEKGRSYFLGVSDDYVKSVKKIEIQPLNDNVGVSGISYFRFSSVSLNSSATGANNSLLTHAMVEDLGSSYRYRYNSNHSVMDMMDVFASSDKVSFDTEAGVVSGKEEIGEFFSYRIDTVHPWNALHIDAIQSGTDGKQVRFEYSFDNAFWKEALSTQKEGKSTFDLTLDAPDSDTSVVYVRVSYAGSKDSSGSFGLDEFHVTASMPKEMVQKSSYR